MSNLVYFEAYLFWKCDVARNQLDKFVLMELAKIPATATRHRRPNYDHNSSRKCREMFSADFRNMLEVCDSSGEFWDLSQDLVERLEKRICTKSPSTGTALWRQGLTSWGETVGVLTGEPFPRRFAEESSDSGRSTWEDPELSHLLLCGVLLLNCLISICLLFLWSLFVDVLLLLVIKKLKNN